MEERQKLVKEEEEEILVYIKLEEEKNDHAEELSS